MKFTETKEFTKELKHLRKKYKTLNADIVFLKKIIADTPSGDGTKHWNGIRDRDDFKVFKMRMMCRVVKGKKFRVIYAYHAGTGTVEFIDLIEIYFKGDKVNEDRERIKVYIKERE